MKELHNTESAKKSAPAINIEPIMEEIMFQYGTVENYCRHKGIKKPEMSRFFKNPTSLYLVEKHARNLGLTVKVILTRE